MGRAWPRKGSCVFAVSSALLWPALFVWNRSGTPGPAVVKADVNICGVQCNMKQHSMSSSSGSSSRSEWARFCPHPICTHSGGHTAVHQRCTRLCARRCVCVCPHTMRAQGGVRATAMVGEYLKDTAVSSDLLVLATPPHIVYRMVLFPCYAQGCCVGGGTTPSILTPVFLI